jgi:hypothetical protein
MAKTNKKIIYSIIALIAIIIGSLLLYTFLKIREGLKTAIVSNEDAFTVCLNVKLKTVAGRVIPYPYGSYGLFTSSGKYESRTDFSMNEPSYLITEYDIDGSKNIVDRKIIIYPKRTVSMPYCYPKEEPRDSPCDPNQGDIIPNMFVLDVSFEKFSPTYQLLTIGDPSSNNTIKQRVLTINSMGTVYDSEQQKIGSVSGDTLDVTNKKIYVLSIDNPTNTYYNLQGIVFNFTVPIPLDQKVALPKV